MEKFTFKDYLDSKQKLKESIAKTSKCKSIYNVTKYCRLIIGEKNNKSTISFKPNEKILIEWFYPTPESTPEVVSIIINNKNSIDEDYLNTYWSADKLLKWLNKNTIQKIN